MILHRAWKPRGGKQANYGVRHDSRRFSASLHLKLLTVSNRVFAVASQVTALTSATTGLRNVRTCGKRGHIAKMCQQGRQQGKPVKFGKPSKDHKTRYVESQVKATDCDEALFTVKAVQDWADSGITVSPEVNGTPITMDWGLCFHNA